MAFAAIEFITVIVFGKVSLGKHIWKVELSHPSGKPEAGNISIRAWVKPTGDGPFPQADGSGLIPTKKGVAFPLIFFRHLVTKLGPKILETPEFQKHLALSQAATKTTKAAPEDTTARDKAMKAMAAELAELRAALAAAKAKPSKVTEVTDEDADELDEVVTQVAATPIRRRRAAK